MELFVLRQPCEAGTPGLGIVKSLRGDLDIEMAGGVYGGGLRGGWCGRGERHARREGGQDECGQEGRRGFHGKRLRGAAVPIGKHGEGDGDCKNATTPRGGVSRWQLTPRTLQRLFNQHVGIGPKWVINRYRMHEALDRVDADAAVNWAALELGCFGQAQFIRDFKALVRRSPPEYARW